MNRRIWAIAKERNADPSLSVDDLDLRSENRITDSDLEVVEVGR